MRSKIELSLLVQCQSFVDALLQSLAVVVQEIERFLHSAEHGVIDGRTNLVDLIGATSFLEENE